MAKLDVTVQVEKETYELGQGVAGLVAKIKEKAADGLSVSDVVAAVGEEMGALVKAVVGVEQIPAEAREDVAAMARAIALPLADVLGAVVKKPEAAPAAAPAEAPTAEAPQA